MGVWKGPKKGVGNKNSGRKTDAEIVRKYIDLELANSIANEELVKLKSKKTRTLGEMKVIVMPLATKGITEKVEHSGIIKQVHSEDIKNKKEVLELTAEYEEKLKKQILG